MAERADELDPQAAALLEDLGSGVSPPSWSLSVETGRALLDELFADDDPVAVGSTTDLAIHGPAEPIPVRIYTPEGEPPFPILVYYHGGGWMRGSLDGYDGLCRLIAAEADCVVVSVDYRLAPEDPFPAGFEDCYAAAEWAVRHAADIQGDPSMVAVGGDSGGGNLAAGVSLAASEQDGPDIAHQLLIYPAVNPPQVRWFDSYDENATGYLLEMDSVEYYYDHYLASDAHLGNAYVFPLRARDLSGVASATVLTAGFDPLADEGVAYAERLADEGVEVDHLHYDDQIHAFVSLYAYLDAGRQAVDELAASLAAAFG